jgi:hypothetical protein
MKSLLVLCFDPTFIISQLCEKIKRFTWPILWKFCPDFTKRKKRFASFSKTRIISHCSENERKTHTIGGAGIAPAVEC